MNIEEGEDLYERIFLCVFALLLLLLFIIVHRQRVQDELLTFGMTQAV